MSTFLGPATGLSRLLPALVAVSLLGGCGTQVVNPVSGRTERTVMDEQQEVAEGRKAHEQVLAEYGVVRDARLQAYVNDIGQRLAAQSHRANLKWTFTVLDSPEINAFALPGGYVYVTRGIMAFLESEAELAGVIGHEIGHVTARHGAQRATRQQRAGLGVLAATVLGVVLEQRGMGGAAEAASQASQVAAAGYVANYSREQELQADELGAEYLARNRYNPQNMVNVIGVLKSQEQFAADNARRAGQPVSQAPTWLASHPSNDQRLASIRQIAARHQGNYGDDRRASYLQAIDGMAFGESREQGFTRGRQFVHPDLGIAITAPAGWRIRNSAEAIVLVNAGADAGLVVRMAPAQAGRSHDEVIRNFVKAVDGRTDRRSINGLEATQFEGNVRGEGGAASPVRLTLVTGPAGRIFLLQHAARDAATLQRNAGGLAEAQSSFRPLSAADRGLAQPWLVRSVPLPRGGFAELARSSPLAIESQAYAEAQLRLMNSAYGAAGNSREPAPGQLVKVVVNGSGG
jgi:predicted Zn-dependent protease